MSGFEVVPTPTTIRVGLTETISATCPVGKKAIAATASFVSLVGREPTLDVVCATVLP